METPIETSELAERLQQVRLDFYGEHGAPMLAGELGIPIRTWLNYESGVEIPGRILLRFIVLTGVEPAWLSTGLGPQYRLGGFSEA